jgi:phage tail-like protein
MDEFIPIPSFYFSVELDGEPVRFQEVSGLEVNIETEDLIEGGNNLFKYRLPTRQAYGNITLSKGVIKEDNAFHEWIKTAMLTQASLSNFAEGRVKTIKIDLMSPGKEAEAVRSWQVVEAFPIKWSISNLSASEHKIAIETVELAFQYLESLE